MTSPKSNAIPENGKDIRAASGRPLSELTLAAVLEGKIVAEDIGISRETLLRQAQIAEAADRASLAHNLERASELVGVPEDLIIETYEMLRPGRVTDPNVLLAQAERLRRDYGAERIADFIIEAAEVYRRRNLFRRRY